MSAQSLPTTAPRNRREPVYSLIPFLPLILLAGVLLYGVMKEQNAASELRVELARAAQEGRPYSNHGVTVAYDERTFRKHSALWHDVLRACSELDTRFLALEMAVESVPIESDVPVDPDQAVPLTLQRAAESAPVVDLIEQLVDDAVPFWSPLLFDGYQTLLSDVQEMRRVARLLSVEFRAAVQQGDADRALRALRLMLGVADAFDTEVAVVPELVRMAIVSQHRTLIHEALAEDFWSEPRHWMQIGEQLQRRDNLNQRWQRTMNGEWAMMASQLNANPSNPVPWTAYGAPDNLLPFGVPATAKLVLFRSAEGYLNVAGVGTSDPVRKMTQQERAEETSRARVAPRSLISIPLANSGEIIFDLVRPATSAFANAFARHEIERKLTLTAVGIKQYRLQQGRWPRQLAELTKVGLVAGDWSAEPSSQFGYQIAGDETEVKLWAGPYQTAWDVPAVATVDPHTKKYEGLSVTIR